MLFEAEKPSRDKTGDDCAESLKFDAPLKKV
jgi:hypothetical protein